MQTANETNAHLKAIKVRLIVGWICLIPVWWAVAGSIGAVDKMTGRIANEWILLVPASITLMMIGLTIYCLKVRKECKQLMKSGQQ